MEIGLILPFLASVGVTILLRRLDKSNYKLSQIKRYTNKINSEIQELAIEKIQSLRDASIDLDINIKKAKKISEEVHVITEDSKSLVKDLKTGKKDLEDTRTDLIEIGNAISQVRSDQKFVSDGLIQLDNVKKTIQELYQDLSNIREDAGSILEVFQIKLDERSDGILESLTTKVQELDSILEEKTEYIDQNISNLGNVYSKKLDDQVNILMNNSISKIESVRNDIVKLLEEVREKELGINLSLESFDNFAYNLNDKVVRIESKIEEKYKGSEKKFEAQVESLEKDVQIKMDKIYEQIVSSKEILLNGVRIEIESIKNQIDEMSLETMSKRDEILNDTRRQAEGINESINVFQEKYLEAENKLLRQADARKTELTRQIDNFEEEFLRISESLRSETENTNKNILKNLLEFNSSLSLEREKYKNFAIAEINEIRESLELKLREIQDSKETELKDSIFEIEEKIDDKIQKLNHYVQEIKEAIEGSASSVLSDIDDKVGELNSRIDEEVAGTENRLGSLSSYWEEELRKIKEVTSTEIKEVKQNLESVEIQGTGLLTGFKDEYKRHKEVLEDFTNRCKENLQKHVELLNKQLDNTEGKIHSVFEENLAEAADESKRLLKSLRDVADDFFVQQEEKIDRLNQTIDNKISKQLASFLDKGNLQLNQLEEKIGVYIHDVKKNIEHTLKDAEFNNHEHISRFKTEFNSYLKEVTKSNEELIEGFEKDYSKVQNKLENLQTDLNDAITDTISKKDKISKELERQTKEYRENLEEFSEKNLEMESKIEYFDEAKTLIEKSESNLAGLRSMLGKYNSEKIEIKMFMDKLDELNEKRILLEENIENLNNENSKITDFSSTLEEYTQKVEDLREQIETLEKSQGKFKSFDKEVEKLENQIDQLKEKSNEILKTKQELKLMNNEIQKQKEEGDELESKLQSLINEIEIVETREKEITDSLKEIDQKADKLLLKDQTIRSVEAKFEKIEDLMFDLSERHKQISVLNDRVESMKEEAVNVKDDLEGLLVEADEKFEKLSNFLDTVQTIPMNKNKKSDLSHDSVDFSKRKKAVILNLYQNFKWSTDTIAEKLNIEKSLVNTIIQNELAKNEQPIID